MRCVWQSVPEWFARHGCQVLRQGYLEAEEVAAAQRVGHVRDAHLLSKGRAEEVCVRVRVCLCVLSLIHI